MYMYNDTGNKYILNRKSVIEIMVISDYSIKTTDIREAQQTQAEYSHSVYTGTNI